MGCDLSRTAAPAPAPGSKGSSPVEVSHQDRNFCVSGMDDLVMCARGKAYKPTQTSVALEMLEQVKPIMRASNLGCADEDVRWRFVDLGSGHGNVATAMSRAVRADNPETYVFDPVVAVELDPQIHAEAVASAAEAGERPAQIQFVCQDLFEYVQELCAESLAQPTVFFLYEPLWRASLSEAEIIRMYDHMLANLANAVAGSASPCLVVYLSGARKSQVPASSFGVHGFVLNHRSELSNTPYLPGLWENKLEVWAPKGFPSKPKPVVPAVATPEHVPATTGITQCHVAEAELETRG